LLSTAQAWAKLSKWLSYLQMSSSPVPPPQPTSWLLVPPHTLQITLHSAPGMDANPTPLPQDHCVLLSGQLAPSQSPNSHLVKRCWCEVSKWQGPDHCHNCGFQVRALKRRSCWCKCPSSSHLRAAQQPSVTQVSTQLVTHPSSQGERPRKHQHEGTRSRQLPGALLWA
jgi:hypothetical protein